MGSKLQTANRVRKEEGYVTLVKLIYVSFIRSLLPTVGYLRKAKPLNHDGVKIDQEEKLFDKYLDLPRVDDGDTTKELGLRIGHLALTQRDDHVVIIGGGNGISATTAARQVGPGGKVTIFDGMTGENDPRFGIAHVERGLELNGVEDRCVTRHGLVGSKGDTVEMYATHMDYEVPTIHPSELPECDVLEFDCNGMELDILRQLEIRPRAMIVELEAPFYKELFDGEAHPREVLEVLDGMGYTIVQQFGHEGTTLSPEQLLSLIDEEYESGEKHQLDSGAMDSPVLLALRTDWDQTYAGRGE
jgi:hypothetical protein